MLKKNFRGDLEVDLFRAPKRSIILLKSKFSLQGVIPVFSVYLGKNMILKGGGGKNISLISQIIYTPEKNLTIYNRINAGTITVSKFVLLTVLFGTMTIISCIPACFVVISSAVI